jgi:hypothetical protein
MRFLDSRKKKKKKAVHSLECIPSRNSPQAEFDLCLFIDISSEQLHPSIAMAASKSKNQDSESEQP